MHDNKVRLSQDVLEKAEHIASEWGLKNARAAVEAVFRKYCDDYLYGRVTTSPSPKPMAMASTRAVYTAPPPVAMGPASPKTAGQEGSSPPACEALDALDRLLAL